jgi:hypothetical protein
VIALVHDGKEATLRTYIGNNPVDQKLQVPELKEWPTVPVLTKERIQLTDSFQPTLKEALECASSDESRYVLKSVCLDILECFFLGLSHPVLIFLKERQLSGFDPMDEH